MPAPVPCAACGGAMVWCEVGIDAALLTRALDAGDVPAALALRPWQCTRCGSTETLPITPHAATLAHLRDEHAAHRVARARAFAARERFDARNARLAREAEDEARRRAEKSAANASKSAVEAALARARAARGTPDA